MSREDNCIDEPGAVVKWNKNVRKSKSNFLIPNFIPRWEDIKNNKPRGKQTDYMLFK